MEHLVKLRKSAGKTQQDLAEYLGISRQAYANYENDTRKPDYETLLKLSEYFSVSVDYLLRGKEKPATSESDELNDYLEELKNRPEMRMLFSLTKGATKEEVERAVRIIEAALGK